MAGSVILERPRAAEEVAGEPRVAAGPRPGRRAPRRRPSALLLTGRVLMLLGLFLGLFAVFELTLTGLAEQRAQASLLTQFRQGIVTTTLDAPATSLPEGSAVALLSIPSIGLHQVVVEGTSPSDLKSGPGHLQSSPLPGEYGNSVIAGRRTTYGGPFGDLDKLVKGAVINVATGQGSAVYVVNTVTRVSPGQNDPLLQTADSRLTLVTGDPALLASGRLVVEAKLRGRPLDVARRPTELVGAADLGLAGDPIGLAVGLVWAELLAVVLWLAWRFRHRWPAVVVYLLAVPLGLVLAVLAFSSLDLLLPGTQ